MASIRGASKATDVTRLSTEVPSGPGVEECLSIIAREYTRLEQRCHSLETSLQKVSRKRTNTFENGEKALSAKRSGSGRGDLGKEDGAGTGLDDSHGGQDKADGKFAGTVVDLDSLVASSTPEWSQDPPTGSWRDRRSSLATPERRASLDVSPIEARGRRASNSRTNLVAPAPLSPRLLAATRTSRDDEAAFGMDKADSKASESSHIEVASYTNGGNPTNPINRVVSTTSDAVTNERRLSYAAANGISGGTLQFGKEELTVRDIFAFRRSEPNLMPAMTPLRRMNSLELMGMEEAVDAATFRKEHRWTLDPDSTFRVFFEGFTAMMCLQDCILVPYNLAWDPESTAFTQGLALFTVSFWLTDMALNFFTGYYHNGSLVLDRREIAFHYLKTWFMVDLSINTLDLVTALLEVTSSDGGGRASLRVLRAMKLNRLLRIVLVFNRFKQKQLGNVSGSLSLVGFAVRLIVIFLVLNHIFCCVWFWIGRRAPSDTGSRWLHTPMVNGDLTYADVEPIFQYLTSLHWCMTQMTPASMTVVPQNSLERVWAIICLVTGLFVSAMLISQMSARTVGVQMANSTETAKFEKLQRFLEESEVQWNLSMRVQRQIKDRSRVKQRLKESDVEVLRLLSSSLRRELSTAVFGRHFMRHTLFYFWDCMCHRHLTEAMCFAALEMHTCAQDDDVFTPVTTAEKCYLLLKGALVYSCDKTNGPAEDQISVKLLPEIWLSEVAIWTIWTHQGILKAELNTDLLVVKIERLLEIVVKFPALRSINTVYAAAVHQVVQDPYLEHFPDVRLHTPLVMAAMPPTHRVQVLHPLLDMVYDKFGVSRDLEDGNCVLHLLGTGRVVKVVVNVELRVLNTVHQSLMQVFEVTDLGAFPVCKLPSTIPMEGETSLQALNRLLEESLPHVKDCPFEWKPAKVEYVEADRESSGRTVITEHIKIIFTTQIDEEAWPVFSEFPSSTDASFDMSDFLQTAEARREEMFVWMWPEQIEKVIRQESSGNMETCKRISTRRSASRESPER